MRNYEKSYYKTFLDYPGYKANLSDINTINYVYPSNIEKIQGTDNDDFVWIFLFEKWLEKDLTSYNWKYNGKTWVKDTASKKFDDFNLNPYDEKPSPNRIIPVVDFGDFITFFNGGEENKDFNKLLEIDYNLYFKDLKKFDFYISASYPELKESMEGTFFDVMNILGFSPDDYFSKETFFKKVKNKKDRTIFSYNSLAKTGDNILKKNIETLNDRESFKIEQADDIQINDRKILLNDTARRIFKLVQAFVDMYAAIFNVYQQNKIKEPAQPYQIDTGSFNIAREEAGSISIDESLRLARPKIKPAFKKSYIVRENNLKPFLNIRMEYQVGLDSNEFIDVNYFTVPYNNILSLEHTVKDFNMTVVILDTEGNISELLIQKMYAASQKKANAKVEKNVRPTGEYRFYVEYGWAGPDTDSDDELMEEQVYTKTIHRGYIKSISSQFSFKGTEYTLNIIPNDLSSYNDGFNDTNSLYYDNFDGSSFTPTVGLLVLYLLLQNPADDLYKKIMANDINTPFLQKLFNFIETLYIVKNNNGYYFVQKQSETQKDNLHKKIGSTYFNLSSKVGDSGNKVHNPAAHQIADKLFNSDSKKDNPKLLNGEMRAIKKLTSIKYTSANLQEIQNVCDKQDIKINAWLAGVYVIWKTKKDRDGKSLLCDNTGLFNIFNEEGKFKEDSDIFEKIIKIFNPYCLKTTEITGTYGESIYNYITQKNNFNSFYIAQILNLEPDSVPRENERPRPLTFLVKQLNTIFSEIKNIGMNQGQNDDDNVYHGADGIMLYYDVYRPTYDNMDDFLFEYKRKIYSDRNNIYWDTTLCSNEEERHEYKYKLFEEEVKKASKAKNRAAFSSYDEATKQYTDLATSKASEIEKNRNKKYQKDPKNKKQESEKAFKKSLESKNAELEKEIETLTNEFTKTTNAAKRQILPWPVFYLTYITNPEKVASLNCSLSKKISLLGRQLVQSYSYTPRISPKTRSFNRQTFSQGNSSITREGSGDIIEFSIDPVDIGNFNSIMLANKNKNNVGYNNVSSHTFASGMYQNASQYYKSYRSIDGNENISKIAQDMARLDLNYQSQMVLKGNITIIGEPYWSNVNLLMSKCIYVNVYYANGSRCSHSGLYYVSGVVQSISDGKFTTKIEILRAPTFLSALEKIVNKNKHIS